MPDLLRIIGRALAATALVPVLALGVNAATPARADVTIPVQPDGTVATDPSFGGPQITEIRVIEEGNFLEIYWDRYVDEEAAVDPANITLLNGDTEVPLRAKAEDGRTDTIFFDRQNKQIAATDANSMERLPEDLHLASIAYSGSIDVDLGLTAVVSGSQITDEDGAVALEATYTSVPELSYYTQSLTTASGIVIKANARVAETALQLAAEQVDVQLARVENGIAAQMAEYGCSLAVYGARENAYVVPEHRRGYDPASYDVEGFGGSTHNDCVSSVSERNVLRSRGDANPYLNTAYPNENILIHEFGHAVRLVGMETMADDSLSEELHDVYENAYLTGLWPNTYAISNIDEYFATLSTVWFDVMAEAPDWSDGVRSPINTRAELKAYDPQAYAFFAKVYPDDVALPAPWDEPAPDEHSGDYTQPPAQAPRVTATELGFGSDDFRIVTQSIGGDFQIDRFAGDSANPERDMVVWFTWGDGVWTVDYADGAYTIAASDGSGVLTAVSATEVRYLGEAADAQDTAQRWLFVPDHATEHTIYDGVLVNAATGTALTLTGRPATGVSMVLGDVVSATSWMLESTTRTQAQGTAAYVLPVEVLIQSEGRDPVSASVAQQGFALPAIDDVAGADWSRAGFEFTGWYLAGAEDPLPQDWAIPDGTTSVTLVAGWEQTATTPPPTDPSEPADPADPVDPGEPVDPAEPDDANEPGDGTVPDSGGSTGSVEDVAHVTPGAATSMPATGAGVGGGVLAAVLLFALGGAALVLVRHRGLGNVD